MKTNLIETATGERVEYKEGMDIGQSKPKTKWTRESYEVQMRGNDGKWYVLARCRAVNDAEKELVDRTRGSVSCGLVQIPKDEEPHDYRIVKIVSECEIVATVS